MTLNLAKLTQPTVKVQKKASPNTRSLSLFNRLHNLRALIAEEEKLPAHIIFSDASLESMERRLPRSEEEFGEITGVGEVKQRKYARRFLDAIVEHQQTKLSTYKQSLFLFKKGLTPTEIAADRELKEDTIHGHLLRAHHMGEKINIDQFISASEIKAIEEARSKIENPTGLKPYFHYFDKQWPYWKIKYGLYKLGTRSF